MRYILPTALFLALLAPPLALASTYQWRDDNGVTHFTDDPDTIPARFEKRVKELGSVRAETNPAPQAPPPRRDPRPWHPPPPRWTPLTGCN